MFGSAVLQRPAPGVAGEARADYATGWDGDGEAGTVGAEQALAGGLLGAVDELAGLEPEQVGAQRMAGFLKDLSCALDRLSALRGRCLAWFDRVDGAKAAGAGNTTGWATATLRLPPAQVKKQLETAQAVEEHDRTRQAYVDGEVSQAHVQVITKALDDPRLACCEGLEQELLELAGRVEPGALARHIRRLTIQLAPADAVQEAAWQYRRRDANLRQAGDGMWELHARLDKLGGEYVATALDAFTGPEPKDVPPELRRSAGQRRADALVEISKLVLDHAMAPEAGGERPHVSVTMTAATLQAHRDALAAAESAAQEGAGDGLEPAELAWSGPIDSETARLLALADDEERAGGAGGASRRG